MSFAQQRSHGFSDILLGVTRTGDSDLSIIEQSAEPLERNLLADENIGKDLRFDGGSDDVNGFVLPPHRHVYADASLARVPGGEIADQGPSGAQNFRQILSADTARISRARPRYVDQPPARGIEQQDTFPAVLSAENPRRDLAETIHGAEVQRVRYGERLKISERGFDFEVDRQCQCPGGIFQAAPSIGLLLARK